MLKAFLLPAYTAPRHFVLDPDDGMPVGLQSVDGNLRILGAAFLAHPFTQNVFKRTSSNLFRYMVSLPEQAQVDRGAAMASFTTAKANGFFTRYDNLNRNSATLDQLNVIANLDPGHANRWHTVRSYRVHPLTDDELSALSKDTHDR
jgi:hypothetical protein